MLQGYWGPGCHLNTLIDLANAALASRSSVKTICMISGGYRTHRGVTGPMNFKSRTFFFFLENRAPGDSGAPGCHPSFLIDLLNTALASKDPVETICMFSEGYRTERGGTGPMNFKNQDFFFGNSCSRGIGALAAI